MATDMDPVVTVATDKAPVEKVPFKKNQIKLAVNALLAYHEKEKEEKKKSELFESKQRLWLMFGLRKIPSTEIKPHKIPLPHPMNRSSEVCYISSEPGKVVKEIFEEKGITNVQKVISLTKLRTEYKTFALKRQLVTTYDVFLCEEKIYHFVSKSLGRAFYQRKKEPIPVRTRYSDLKKEIDKCISSTLLRIGHGPCSSVAIGDIKDHTPQELIENAIHAMRIIGKKMPGEWDNIKSVHIKTHDSVALPVYQGSPLATNDIRGIRNDPMDKKPKRKKRKVAKTLRNTNPDKQAVSEENKPIVSEGVAAEKNVTSPDTNEPKDDVTLSEHEIQVSKEVQGDDECIKGEDVDEEDKNEEEPVIKKKKKTSEKKEKNVKKAIPAKKAGPKKIKPKK